MKILILSCNTGAGHNMAAFAVRDMMIKLGHECVTKDALAYASRYFSNGVSKSYNSIVMHTPKVFGVGYRYCKNKTYTPGRTKSATYALNMMYSKKLYVEILREGYDAVLCTHVFAAQSITHVKHKHGLNIPIYAIATDYSFCPYYDELDMNKYFISLDCIKQDYLNRGIPNEKIIPSGIPVSDKFIEKMSRKKAREELGLYTDEFICLIMSGSMGFGKVTDFIDEVLQRNIGESFILVITGNNINLKNEINDKYSRQRNVMAIGYTDKVHLYMKASNIIVTKPGGLTSTEAMVCNIPIILSSPIPGVETENYEILTSLGVAIGGKDTLRAARVIEEIYKGSALTAHIKFNQQRYINTDAAMVICKEVLHDLGVEC